MVHFISPVAVGVQFHMSEWPLHTTLVDVFAIDRSASNINIKLAQLLEKTDPVTTLATTDTILGTTAVTLLVSTPSLVSLHVAITNLLETNGAAFNTPEFNHDGFLPHSTIQQSGRLLEGDGVTIGSISLVDLFPDGDWQQRKVVATFTLG